MSEVKPFSIDRFLGVNESATETLLQLGEAASMSNFIITDDNKLSKMFGYTRLFEPLVSAINGMWYGEISGTAKMIFACGTKVYEHNLSTHANTDIGTIANSSPVTFFVDNNTVYIMDGTGFFSWPGSGNIASVTGYIPTVFTATPPTGGGTLLENINYLTGAKIMKFSGDATATVYQLPELIVTSVDTVVVGATTMEETTDYVVSLANGTVTFVSAPATGVNNVVVTWTKTIATDRPMITNCRYYGGTYYARKWLYGNVNHKATRFPSGVTMAGVSDPTYWPKYSESDVGDYEITDITIQHDRQIIFTDGDSSGASAWYSTIETYTDVTTGIVTTLFPVFPMSAKVGNVAKGQTQIITNNPFTIWKGVFEWETAYIKDEKSAKWISKRIQPDLDLVDLSTAITWDWDDKGIYILCVGKKLWCLNYRVDGAKEKGAWYILDLPHTPTCFTTIDSELYFGTSTGTIMKFDTSVGTFDGTEITTIWDMGYYNFGVDYIRKFIQDMFISILPLTSTHVDIYVSTDRDASFRLIDTVSYGLSGFDTWDFSNFSFETNFSPQPKKVKLKAKKIDYIKLRLVCNGLDGAKVLSITLPTRQGGLVKNRS